MLDMRKSTLLSRALVCGALAFASFAHAMPSKDDIKKAKPVVDSLIADDLYVLNKKMKPPAAVVSKIRSLVEKADTEAGKFLLLQNIFSVYASNSMYDEAGDALENLSAEISYVPPEEIVKMVDGAMGRVDPEKAPKVLSIYRAAQRKVKCRRRLESAKAEFKKRPNDKALIRTIGDCYVGMGDWPRALKAYAMLGIAAAKYEMSPTTTPNCDAMAAADFWWDYKAADDEPFKVHAAELYSAAVEKDLATGLRREMALKRIEDSKKLGALRAQARGPATGSTNTRSAAKEPKCGDTKKLTLPGGAKMEMIYVAPGEFMMGSNDGGADERPVHRVKLTKGFWLGKYEVTQKQWQSVMGSNPSQFQGGDKPVENISWHDCQNFISKLNGQLNCGARLPTEAEWEYACRAGTTGPYASAKINSCAAEHPDSVKTLYAMGWYSANSASSTHPVGKKQPNPWGLYDMHGNVSEWCNDLHDGSYYSKSTDVDPQGGGRGCIGRVLRGGNWNSRAAGECTSAFRPWNRPGNRTGRWGFRLCCTDDNNASSDVR